MYIFLSCNYVEGGHCTITISLYRVTFLTVHMTINILNVDVLMLRVLLQGTGKWYEMQDLQVTDILPQMITLSEAYIQVQSSYPFCCLSLV